MSYPVVSCVAVVVAMLRSSLNRKPAPLAQYAMNSTSPVEEMSVV